MFYFADMQWRFDFGGADITRWRDRLKPMLAAIEMHSPRPPTGQLIKSMISGRTRDDVSGPAYDRLKAQYRTTTELALASPDAVLRLIEDVTFADRKAAQLIEALRLIRQRRGDLRLSFLRELPIDDALSWLEDLPGVGRKVAASVLNASTLERPVLIVDTHVMRVLARLGFVDRDSPPRVASEAVTATMRDWTAQHFLHFHVQLKRLGQLHCHPTDPDCGRCPLAADCLDRRRKGRTPRLRRTRRPNEASGLQLSILV